MTSTAIRAVTFDLWATLLSSPAEGGAERHLHRVAALHDALCARGDAVERAAIDQLMRREWRRYNAIWSSEQRTLLNRERLEWMLAELGVAALDEASSGRVCEAFDESLWRGAPRLQEGAAEALRALVARGVVLGVVSDTSYSTGRTLRRLLANEGVLELFVADALVFSDEHGASKPRPELFLRSLTALGVETPAQAAHVGDNPATDIRGANAAGMRSVLFLPEGEGGLDRSVGEARPDHVLRDFAELAGILGL